MPSSQITDPDARREIERLRAAVEEFPELQLLLDDAPAADEPMPGLPQPSPEREDDGE